MQFKVPQFLDIEDKIFGPFTFRQFIYLAGGAGICFIFYRLLGFWFGFIPILLVACFVLALAFYRPNNKPFIFMVEAAIKYFVQDKLYVWKRRKVLPDKYTHLKEGLAPATPASGGYARAQERLSGSRLRDLAWSLDVLDLSKSSEATDAIPTKR